MANVVFATAAVRPITNNTWEAFGQHVQCFKFGVIFMFVCSPYYFLWLSKISITLGSGTENGLWTPEAYILFYFYSFLWGLHYSLMPEFFPKLLFFPPFSFFSIVFFGLPIYWVQLHRSDLMPGLGLCSSEQQKTPRLLDFIDSINPLPSLWENGLAECWCLFIFFQERMLRHKNLFLFLLQAAQYVGS